MLLIWIRLWALIRKEFVVMFMDKGTRKILILPILIQSLLFGYGATFNLESVPYIVLNHSTDRHANELLLQIYHTPSFELVKTCHDEPCFAESLDRGEALLGLFIDSNFDQTHEIFVATDARNTSSANMALSYVQSIVSTYNVKIRQDYGRAVPYAVEYRYLFNENNITRYGLMTGMILALSMIQVMMLASFSVSREREEGTFDMMLMTPLTPVEILIGKAIPPTVIACLQALALFLICLFWFEIPFSGNLGSLMLVIFLFSLCNVGIGLAISALSSTSQQSVVTSFSLVLPCIILSGMITPYSAMPALAQYIALLNPFYYGLEALHRIYLEGQSISQVVHLLLPLIGLGMITLTSAVLLFRGKLS